jgi:hypothetical protein
VYGTFAHDLERIRSGRTDGLNQDTREILAAFDANGYDRALLHRVRVVVVDTATRPNGSGSTPLVARDANESKCSSSETEPPA